MFHHACIILDACCVINLYASGHMDEILLSLPPDIFVATYVHEQEVLSIFSGPLENAESSKQQIDLSSLVSHGLINIASLTTEEEEILFINLSVELDDGEAATSAIAFHRNWGIATDDGKALKIIRRDAPHLQLLSTLALIRYWADTTNQPFSIVQLALKNVHLRARYRPGKNHPFFTWWLSYQES
jgi:predicted nucleic acid-binding protein